MYIWKACANNNNHQCVCVLLVQCSLFSVNVPSVVSKCCTEHGKLPAGWVMRKNSALLNPSYINRIYQLSVHVIVRNHTHTAESKLKSPCFVSLTHSFSQQFNEKFLHMKLQMNKHRCLYVYIFHFCGISFRRNIKKNLI